MSLLELVHTIYLLISIYLPTYLSISYVKAHKKHFTECEVLNNQDKMIYPVPV